MEYKDDSEFLDDIQKFKTRSKEIVRMQMHLAYLDESEPASEDENQAPANAEEFKVVRKFSLQKFLEAHPILNVKDLCNFSLDQLLYLVDVVREHEFSSRRGRKNGCDPLDALFLTLTYYCTYLPLQKMSGIVSLKQSYLSKIINKTTNRMFPIFIAEFIPKQYSPCDKEFDNFPTCVAAVDSSTIPFTVPLDLAERKSSWDAKNHCNGMKVQVLVNPLGQVIHMNTSFLASVHDKKVFDLSGASDFLHVQRGVESVALGLLADRGYIGIQKYHPTAVIMQRGDDEEVTKRNNAIAHDRQIVERRFARDKSNWSVLAIGYRGEKGNLPLIVQGLFALDNYHIDSTPLSEKDNCDFPCTPKDEKEAAATPEPNGSGSPMPKPRCVPKDLYLQTPETPMKIPSPLAGYEKIDKILVKRTQNAIYNIETKMSIPGLHNEGATCHVNAVLQVLFYVNTFRKDVMEHLGDVEYTPVKALAEIYDQMLHYRHKEYTISCSQFITTLGKQYFQQQDADDTFQKIVHDVTESANKPDIAVTFQYQTETPDESFYSVSLHIPLGAAGIDQGIKQMCTDDSHINEISTFLWVDVQRNWSDPNVFFDKFEIKKNYKTQLSDGTYVFKIHSIIAYHQGHFVAFVNKGRVWFMLDDEITYIVPDGLIKGLQGGDVGSDLWSYLGGVKWLAKCVIYRKHKFYGAGDDDD
ncbi:ZGC:162945 family [Trichomonas vaginalis G3]|uniref:ZGC:162945 family n=1 Tax=Trichomonas vaginalis (strain ATCC PRA-98 / G3) TaxID=412133 RepID=UPI0021E5DD25|nr:ZGC:162945 family [Trichomonas vaginalis G3]KAI5500664.1 ZGC:162945 family [Trichomonas vaginalis G3]